MPMIRNQLKEMSGTTLNTELSPDQSIAHGATYYAGMLLTNDKFARSILNEQATERLSTIQQRSVTARALGILVRKHGTRERTPNYLIKANSPLPVQETRDFGTVVDNQRRVHLQIVESGPTKADTPTKIGDCTIFDLPEDLPESSKIAVTISYDEQARVHVSARDKASGQEASIEIVRRQILVSPEEYARQRGPVSKKTQRMESPQDNTAGKEASKPANRIGFVTPDSAPTLEDATAPVPLCNDCGEPLDVRGRCVACVSTNSPKAKAAAVREYTRRRKKKPSKPAKKVEPKPLIDEDDVPLWDPDADDFWNLIDS